MVHHLFPTLLSLLTITITILSISSTHAQSPPQPTPTPTPGLSTAAQEFLDAHNEARAQVGVGPMRWSPNLAKMTSRLTMYQRLKNNCEFIDVSSSKIKYGANQLWAQAQGKAGVSPKVAVNAWVGEKKYYNHTSNTCQAKEEQQCGVYTQVVWRKSVELGCGEASCAKNGTTLILCFYNPPGNVVGESPY